MQPRITDILIHFGLGGALAALGAALALWALRSRRPLLWIILLTLLPGAAIAAASPNFRMLAFHGFMHTSYVYRFIDGVWPPEDTVAAGRPLLYAWAHHAVLARVCHLLNIAPSVAVCLLDVPVLIATMLLLAACTREFVQDKAAAALSALLGMVGYTLVHYGPIGAVIATWVPHARHRRQIPLDKFFNFNNNQLGLLAFAAFMLLLIRFFTRERGWWPYAIGLAAAQAFAVFFYPMTWVIMGVSSAAVIAYVLISSRGRAFNRVCIYAGASIIGSGFPAPYLFALSRGKSASAHLSFETISAEILGNLASLLLAFVALAALAWVYRHELRKIAGAHRTATGILLSIALATGLLYVFIAIPFNGDDKFIVATIMALAPFAGILTMHLVRSRPIIGFVLLAAFLLPVCRMFIDNARPWPAIEPCHEQGMFIRADDPEMDTIYSWLAEQTPTNAVIIDRGLDAPVFARRPLFIALNDPRPRPTPDRPIRDGWTNTPDEQLCLVAGYTPEFVTHRRAIAETLLATGSPDDMNQAARKLAQELPNRPVFAIARDQATRDHLAAGPFRLAHESAKAWVFELKLPPEPAPTPP